MLDYKDIINKHYALNMSGREIARETGVSKSGVNGFLTAFARCKTLSFPLPKGITNQGIAEAVYGKNSEEGFRDKSYELPDFVEIDRQMCSRKNMTLAYLWNQYRRKCEASGKKFYQYRQFCERYSIWKEDNEDGVMHFTAVAGRSMEVDFAGQTFKLDDSVSGEKQTIVVFVAVLPYSQYIYAEGMLSTKEPQWIAVNNHALEYFGGIPEIVACDNCKQAVIANKDWIAPELNKDYAEWAEYYETVIMAAKVRRPRYKSSVENAVGILEKGIFHTLENLPFFSLDQFNKQLHLLLDEVNHTHFAKKEHDRHYYWLEEKEVLKPLPSVYYEYTERKTAKVSSDFHIRFDNAYYSVKKAFKHRTVIIRATSSTVSIYDANGNFIESHPRATRPGQWLTEPSDLPEDYNGYSEWSSTYFIRRATTVGPDTCEVIKTVLKSRKYEVQTYRMCLGILNFAKKFGSKALEQCCTNALKLGKINYTFIKNTVASYSDENLSPEDLFAERNKGAFLRNSESKSLENLVSKTELLAKAALDAQEEKE